MPDRGPLIYLPPSLRHFEPAFLTFSTWMDHLPFGYDIVEAVRPRLLVELGSHKGFSYFTFCQSMKDHDIDGLCYAVDTWEGDRHTDSYGEEVFQEVNRYNRQHYAGFSYLLRMLFEEALGHFEDASVDLIHIDGLHTYEAVRRDFEDWYPKLRPGGIMLFHDIAARIKDFGVWRFWGELEAEHQTFRFDHGFGLGVLRKPGGEAPAHPLLRLLFSGDEDTAQALRRFYVHAAEYHDLRRKAHARGSGD